MKIKMNKKVLLIAGIAIFAIILGILFNTYAQQLAERDALQARLAAAQAQQTRLMNDKEKRADELAQAQSLLDASMAKFPQSVESIEYGEDLFKISYGEDLHRMAAGCGVDLTSLRASIPSGRTVGDVTYSVSSFSVTVKGDVDDILKFIDAVGTRINYKLPWSFQLPWSVEVTRVNIHCEREEADINLDIYAYKG